MSDDNKSEEGKIADISPIAVTSLVFMSPTVRANMDKEINRQLAQNKKKEVEVTVHHNRPPAQNKSEADIDMAKQRKKISQQKSNQKRKEQRAQQKQGNRLDDTTTITTVISSGAEANPIIDIFHEISTADIAPNVNLGGNLDVGLVLSRAEFDNNLVSSTIGDMLSDNTEFIQSSISNVGTVPLAIIDLHDTTSLNIVIEATTTDISHQTESGDSPTSLILQQPLDVKLTKRSTPELINAVLKQFCLVIFLL
jgi:hypothetical protein